MACSKERGRSLCAKLPNKTVDGTGIIRACVASVPVRKKSSQTIFRKPAARPVCGKSGSSSFEQERLLCRLLFSFFECFLGKGRSKIRKKRNTAI